MTSSTHRHETQSSSKLHNLLNPESKFLNTPVRLGNGNRVPLRAPMSQKPKDSPITNTSFSNQTNQNLHSSSRQQQPFSSRFLDFTPVDSRFQRNHYPTADFNLRSSNKNTSVENHHKNSLNTNQTFSEFSYSNKSNRVDNHQQEMEDLRRENQDLKRRLSLKVQCSCKAPYVQEEVEYLRSCFMKHIETHHKDQKRE